MPTMTIKGSVWPSGAKITLPDLKFAISSATTSTVTINSHCRDSRVTIQCESPDMIKENPDSVGFVIANARMLFDGALSLASVYEGRAYLFIVEHVSFEETISLDINIEYAFLRGLITAFSMDDFSATMTWITADVQVLLVLQDLNSAMSNPFYLQVGCGRAIDGIRHAIAGPDGDPGAKKWPEFNRVLNIDRSYVQHIMAASVRGRHGQRLVGGGHDSNEILRRAWILFNRFLEYRKRGNVALTSPDFPLLTH